MKKIIDGQEYNEVEIEKLIINGKEQDGFVISAEQTKGISELNVTLQTKKQDTEPASNNTKEV